MLTLSCATAHAFQAVQFDGWPRVLLLPQRSKKRPAVCRYVPPGADKVQDDPNEAEIMRKLNENSINLKEVCVGMAVGCGGWAASCRHVIHAVLRGCIHPCVASPGT